MSNDQLVFIAFNTALFIAGLIIIIAMRKKIKSYHMYIYEKYKPVEYSVIIVITLVLFTYFVIFFSPVKSEPASSSDISISGDVTLAQTIDTSTPGVQSYTYTFTESEYGSQLSQDLTIEVVSDGKLIKKAGDGVDQEATRELKAILLGKSNVSDEELHNYLIDELGVTKQSVYDQYLATIENWDPVVDASLSVQNTQLTIPVGTEITFEEALDKAGIEFTDEDISFGEVRKWRYEELIKRQVPVQIGLIAPAFLIATLMFHFVFYNKKIVAKYVNELYEINKFCGFLTYNLTYRNNSKVLIQETLASIDDGQFSRDFELIFFEKGRDMKDKLADISAIYNYKFFEMYLRIANIIFDEGTSDETIKSLEIIQTMGDTYFDKVDLFFRTKESSMGQVRMIIVISSLLPFIVKTQSFDMFSYYQNTNGGYMFIMMFYLAELGIFLLTQKIYRDNKIIKKEGRYV